MTDETFYRLALHRKLANHPRGLAMLMQRFRNNARAVFDNCASHDLISVGLPDISLDIDVGLGRQLESDLRWLEDDRHDIVSAEDSLYPSLLLQTFDPPFLLFASGNLDALGEPGQPPIAIVGARKASQYGLDQAFSLADRLAAHGVVIYSGLALGVDGAAHRGALNAGGKTIAVLGTGCDVVYPGRHRKLAGAIAENGLILSEFPLGTPAYPSNFPRRNRLVTGSTVATLVIEAGIKSGSLISARLALSEGREVMALPGQVTNPGTRGTHHLIRDGAMLITSAEDVLLELGIAPERRHTDARQLTDRQAEVVALLGLDPLSVDELSAVLDCPLDELFAVTMDLEIEGLIRMEAGRYFLTKSVRA